MSTQADPHWQDADSLTELVEEGRRVRLLRLAPRPRRRPEHSRPLDVPDRARALVSGMPGYGS